MGKRGETKVVRIPSQFHDQILDLGRGDFGKGIKKLERFYNQVQRDPRQIIVSQFGEIIDTVSMVCDPEDDAEFLRMTDNLVAYMMVALRTRHHDAHKFREIVTGEQPKIDDSIDIQRPPGGYQ